MLSKKHFLATFFLVTFLSTASAATCSSIEHELGITWTFNREYECGTFANNDHWVLGPVTITSITPDFDGSYHGWEVNPEVGDVQAFDTRVAHFTPSLVPELPYTAQPGESIVKSISIEPLGGSCRPCLEAAAVLTVLGEAPPGNGADVFRPPYVSTEKPYYYIADLHPELLPSFESTEHALTLDQVRDHFKGVRLDHKPAHLGAFLHPVQNMPEYGSQVGSRGNEAILSLMLNYPVEEKTDAIIAAVQAGLDTYHMGLEGRIWPAMGGHGFGRLLPISFAAVLLQNQEMKDFVINSDSFNFGETQAFYYSENAGVALYGEPSIHCREKDVYWGKLVFGPDAVKGSKECVDPYGYIDGGYCVGCGYLSCCAGQPTKGVAIAGHLMPKLKELWTNNAFLEFSDRKATFGGWAQPDPCAPADGVCAGGPNAGQKCTTASVGRCGTGSCELNWDNYGITYGSDGQGGCILDTDSSDGIGRYPQNHGLYANLGGHGSVTVNEMWDAYRDYSAECWETDNSCGISPSCLNCNALDACVGSTSQDYSCESNAAGCSYTEVDCTNCSCSCGGYNATESLVNENCEDTLDNDCDGLIDDQEPSCELGDYLAFIDFEQGNEGTWTEYNPGQGSVSWDVVNDSPAGTSAFELSGSVNAVGATETSSLGSYVILDNVQLQDFVFEASLRSTEGSFWRDLGILFGYQNENQHYLALFNGTCDPTTNGIFEVVAGLKQRIGNSCSQGLLTNQQYHNVKIVRQSPSIEVFFDDMQTPVFTASDSSYGFGSFGIGSVNDTGIFDNIAITSLDSECVDTPTLLNHISSWKQGSLSMLSLMQKLEQWKAGTNCP